MALLFCGMTKRTHLSLSNAVRPKRNGAAASQAGMARRSQISWGGGVIQRIRNADDVGQKQRRGKGQEMKTGSVCVI